MIEQINLISASWFEWMFSMFWQVSLLIIIISGIDYLIRNWAYPQIRYALWTLVLLKLIIPPSWTFTGGIIPNVRSEYGDEVLSILESSESNEQNLQASKYSLPSGQTKDDGEKSEKITSHNVMDESFAPVLAKLNWKFYLMAAWLAGIIIFAFVLSKRIIKLKQWHLEQERKKNIPEWFHEVLLKVGNTLSIQRLPAIVFSNETNTPAVYGVFRPVLLLPEKYIENLSEEEAEHVLLHELAHLKRGDLIMHGICLVLQIIYWFNPFLIWARKQMKHVREICCDITIANILRDKTQKYKDTLINTARELLTETMEPGIGLLGLFEEPFQLIARLKWLNKKTWKDQKLAIASTIIVSSLFVAFVMPMGELEYSYSAESSALIKTEPANEDYREKITSLNEELNDAFVNWDIKTLINFHTDDVIIDPTGLQTVKEKEGLREYFRRMQSSGI